METDELSYSDRIVAISIANGPTIQTKTQKRQTELVASETTDKDPKDNHVDAWYSKERGNVLLRNYTHK